MLFLAVLLTIMQAAPPIPRKAAHTHARKTKNIEQDSGNHKNPSTEPPPCKESIATQACTADSQHNASKDSQHPIAISKLPTVSIEAGWRDDLALIFTGLLLLVGGFGVCAAYRTLGEIKGQRRAMLRQLRTMQKQVNVARDSFEMFISKERARLWIEVVPIQFHERQGRFADAMNYYVKFSGPTDAFIVASSAHTAIDSSREHIPVSDYLGSIFPMVVPQMIGRETELGIKWQYMFPDMLLKQTTIDAIKRGESFVHFFGFIKYRDVFDRERETTFNLLWEVEPPFLIQGTKLPGREGWKEVGPPEVNQKT